MSDDNAVLLVVALALVWWVGRRRPVPSVSTAEQWWDPVGQTWRDF